MQLKRSDRANEDFPLEPYIQTPDKGFMTSGIEAGTLVIPVHPSQIGIPWLKGEYPIAGLAGLALMTRPLQASNDPFVDGSGPLSSSGDTAPSDQISAEHHSELCASQ